MKLEFLYCKHCKKMIVTLKNDRNVPTICCGEPMAPVTGDIHFSHSFKRIQNPARHCKYPECPVSILKQRRLSGARQRFMQAYRKNNARQTNARHGAMANLKTPACRHALDTLKNHP